MSSYKPFSQILCDRYDEPARAYVKNVYNELGIRAVDNPDKYGVDLILFENNIKIGYAEVEVIAGWNGIQYPFKSVHVALRKAKFFNLDLPTEFWAVSNTFFRALHIHGEKILISPIVKVPNKYILTNERFFDVPLNFMTHHGKGVVVSMNEINLY